VKFATTILQDKDEYDIYKTFDDLFLSQEKRDGMILERIPSEDLCKIHSGAGDKKTSGVKAEEKLNEVYGTKYCIRLDHQILTNHGVFYSQALYNHLKFEVTINPLKSRRESSRRRLQQNSVDQYNQHFCFIYWDLSQTPPPPVDTQLPIQRRQIQNMD